MTGAKGPGKKKTIVAVTSRLYRDDVRDDAGRCELSGTTVPGWRAGRRGTVPGWLRDYRVGSRQGGRFL